MLSDDAPRGATSSVPGPHRRLVARSGQNDPDAAVAVASVSRLSSNVRGQTAPIEAFDKLRRGKRVAPQQNNRMCLPFRVKQPFCEVEQSNTDGVCSHLQEKEKRKSSMQLLICCRKAATHGDSERLEIRHRPARLSRCKLREVRSNQLAMAERYTRDIN